MQGQFSLKSSIVNLKHWMLEERLFLGSWNTALTMEKIVSIFSLYYHFWCKEYYQKKGFYVKLECLPYENTFLFMNSLLLLTYNSHC